MFTGLIQSIGTVTAVEVRGADRRLVVDASGWGRHSVAGESISVAGCCLTVAAAAESMSFDVVAETLRRTTLGSLHPGSRVNLEHALRLDSLLGGHLVQGHIDGVGEIVEATGASHAQAGAEGERRLRILTPADLIPLIPPKGSIAVDGVSLTVAAVDDSSFEVALIPTTICETTLGSLAPGDRCNIETDILARTVAHWLSRRG